MAKPMLMTEFARYYEKISRRELGLLTFFRFDETMTTDAVQIMFDRRKSRLVISKAKNRGAQATNNSEGTFDRVTLTPPVYKECMNFSIQEKDVADFGTNPFAVDPDRQVRLLKQVARDVFLLDEKMNGAEVWQASQIFQTGKIPFSTAGYGEGVADVDFGCPETNFATLSNTTGTLYWDNANATPLANLESHCRTIRQNGHSPVRDIIFGRSAWACFAANASVQNEYNIRRIDTGFIRPEDSREGLAFMGTIHLDGYYVNLWRSDDVYVSPADNSTVLDYVDPKNVVFIADGVYEKWYAGIDTIRGLKDSNFDAMLAQYMRADGNITIVGDRMATSLYVDTYDDHGIVMLRAQKAPLCIVKSNDTFGCLKVLA